MTQASKRTMTPYELLLAGEKLGRVVKIRKLKKPKAYMYARSIEDGNVQVFNDVHCTRFKGEHILSPTEFDERFEIIAIICV